MHVHLVTYWICICSLHSVITPNCPSVWNTLHCCIIHAENIWPFLRGKEGVRRDKTLPDFWGICKTFSNTFLAKSYISLLLASLYFHSFFPEASPKHVDLCDPGRLKVPAKYPPNSLACSRSNPSLLALSTAHFRVRWEICGSMLVAKSTSQIWGKYFSNT